MIFGAILAGGIGSRMNIESMPKQFLPLGNKPVLLHTLDKFLLCQEFDAIYLGVHSDWLAFAQDLVFQNNESDTLVRIVAGGPDRNSTIMNIVDAIEEDFGSSPDHIIVTHDSVRPFVKVSSIRKNIDALRVYPACDTVIPATDTIVESGDGLKIDDIPPRGKMYQGQTPQSFRIADLKEAYRSLSEGEKATLTDACKIFVMKGIPVGLVDGDVTNIKLTTIMDYKVAQAMIDDEASFL